ncbi:MAG: hypothetical protein JNL62_06225 [Bryobacterales bacterium]|nr:hypothetical protein [Bryobacterales bacterium]
MHGIGWSLAGIVYCCVLLLAPGCDRSQPERKSSPLQQAIEKQRTLPPPEVTALQDLRLFAAVQATHYSRKQRYATAEELKAARLLDPAWPRSAVSDYSLEVQLGRDESTFEAFADPVKQHLGHYRIDQTQVVRKEPDRRASAASAAF